MAGLGFERKLLKHLEKVLILFFRRIVILFSVEHLNVTKTQASKPQKKLQISSFHQNVHKKRDSCFTFREIQHTSAF